MSAYEAAAQTASYAAPAVAAYAAPVAAPVAMAAPVAAPVVAAAVGEDLAYATCLVCFGALLFIGIVVVTLIPWRIEAVCLNNFCDSKINACKPHRGSANNGLFGINSGSHVHKGDAKIVHIHGHGFSNKDKNTQVSAVAFGGSSML